MGVGGVSVVEAVGVTAGSGLPLGIIGAVCVGAVVPFVGVVPVLVGATLPAGASLWVGTAVVVVVPLETGPASEAATSAAASTSVFDSAGFSSNPVRSAEHAINSHPKAQTLHFMAWAIA